MSTNPHSASAQRWLDSAWKSYQNGQLSTALEHCRKAVKESATLAPPWCRGTFAPTPWRCFSTPC